MNDELKLRWQRMQSELNALLDDLSRFDHDSLNRPPAPGKWSAMQTLVHVMQSEKYTHLYLRKKLDTSNGFRASNLNTRLRSWLLNLALVSPFKFTAPKAVSGENLPKEADLGEIDRSWRGIREDMEALINEMPAALYDKEIYKHPYAGRLTLPGMVHFLEKHFRRHRKQVYRALAGVKAKG